MAYLKKESFQPVQYLKPKCDVQGNSDINSVYSTETAALRVIAKTREGTRQRRDILSDARNKTEAVRLLYAAVNP